MFKNLSLFVILLMVFVAAGFAVDVNNWNQTATPEPEVYIQDASELSSGPVYYLYPARQLLLDSFERGAIAPWTTGGTQTWGMRDTTNTYGPQWPALSGYRYPGHPATDLPQYPSMGSQPGYITYLISPTIDLTGVDSLYLSYSYWGDFEGEATNFDGYIVEISSNNGTTWYQVDPSATGHLNPTYDAELAGTGPLGTAWAYCYDTDPDWLNVSSGDLIALGYVATGQQIKIRFTFASDPLAGGQGIFVDDVRIAATPPADLQPPIIDHTPLTDTPDSLNPYTVTATITDEGTGVNPDSVYLYYEIEGGPGNTVDMSETSPDVYEADIPAQGYHTDILYNINAADSAGNWVQSLDYEFEVTNALTIIYDDGQPYWIPGDLVPPNGLFVLFSMSSVGLDSALLHKVIYFFDGPGPFDLQLYTVSGGMPNTLIDSLRNVQCPGYQWFAAEITNLDVHITGDVVAGFICGASGGDTTRVLMDPTQEYPSRMWSWLNGQWQNPGYGGGDFMIRLKVIPLGGGAVAERPGETTDPVHGLGQPSPNPARDGIHISYQLPIGQHTQLYVYDAVGKLVRKIIDDHMDKGYHSAYWDGSDDNGHAVADGVYFLKLNTTDGITTRKLLMLK